MSKSKSTINWHGDFVFENKNEREFDEFIFDVNQVEEKYYLSDKVKIMFFQAGPKILKLL